MSNDININESAILETLNAKIDYDGGNYKGSGLANYVVDKSGDTMTAPLTIQTTYGGHLQGVKTNIKLGDTPSSQANIGGFRCYAGSAVESNITAIVQGYIRTASNQSSNGIQFITRKPDNSGWGYGMTLETYADGKTYFNFPKCTAKATTTSTANAGNVAVIVQNYVNGTSWYRVWSDGWCEQGGIITGAANIALLKPFIDTNYTVVNSACIAFSKTATHLNITDVNVGSSYKPNPVGWEACGYIV